MKQFPNIIAKLFYEPLVILPQKHSAICQVIESHLAGSPRIEDDDDGDDGGEGDPEYQQVGKAAIIPVHGVIEKHMKKMASAAPGCDLDTLCACIDMAEMDSSVEKIIFDFRTPGGTTTGVPETARKILRCSKETFAFCDSQCCSGGMYLAAQCQKFYATGSACLGSIGVYCAYMDYTGALQKDGVSVQAFSAGKFKLMGAYWKPLSDDEKGIIQARIDKIYGNFKTAMNSVRACGEDSMGNGLTFDGEEAAARGLTDGTVETFEEILDGLVE